jgi:hypothetical protein
MSVITAVACYNVSGMARQQLGMIDADLLAEADEHAKRLGVTRREYTERALRAMIDGRVREPREPTPIDALFGKTRAHQPGPNVENIRSSSQVKAGVGPVPKTGGKR